jgi:hypothetical protein
MDSLTAPIERVMAGSEWFVRTPSVRFLHIATTDLVRMSVLRHLTATELLGQNTCPFFVLEAPTEPADDGWQARSEELRIDWDVLVESASEGTGLTPLWPEESANPPLLRFVRELGHALASCPANTMTGLVIVLAPVWVMDGARFLADLEVLVATRHLGRARFIVVESNTSHALALVGKLGASAMAIDARVDEAAVRCESRARVEAMKAVVPGSTGVMLTGAAGPAVLPPRRRSERSLTPEQRQAVARDSGLSPVLLDVDAMHQLGTSVLSAALAMRDGNAADGIRQQREVRDFCIRHDLRREAAVHELVLASYVLQAGSPKPALELFDAAKQHAQGAGLTDLAVQAQMAIGACFVLLEQRDRAAAAYAEAGQLGAEAGTPALVIEAYRTAGQLLVSIGRTQEAVVAFRTAIEIARDGGPETLRTSTANDVMRELAGLCRRHGLTQQAASLEAQALALEASEPPEA